MKRAARHAEAIVVDLEAAASMLEDTRDQWSAAHQMLARYQMPEGRDVASVFIGWAQKHHWHWFDGRRERADNSLRPADWYTPHDAYPHSEE